MRTKLRRAGISLALAALACASASYRAELEQLRRDFRQLNERQVLSCLGPPSDFDYPDEHRALWAYVQPIAGPLGRGFNNLGAGRIMDRKLREFLTHPLRAAVVPGFCRLTLALVDGQVTDFSAEGRSAAGLNSDAACARTAKICFEPRYGP